MKKTIKLLLAALTMALGACSNDDNVAENSTMPTGQQAVQTVHITVGADIDVAVTDDDTEWQTRSAVDVEEDFETGQTRRRLTFTSGDKLFVFASVAADWDYWLAGTLSIVASSIDADGKTASFSGDLKVYKYEGDTPVESSYAFTDANPLNECQNHKANLIAGDMVEGGYTIHNYWWYEHDYSKSIAEDDPDDPSDDCVSTLMKTALRVWSYKSYKTEYVDDEGPKMFRNFQGDPILDCTISGLTSGTAYTVTLLEDFEESDYDNHLGDIYSVTYATPVTATGGSAHFAISLNYNEVGWNNYLSLKLEGGGETRYVMLGQKESFELNKVYRVNGTATAP